mmetsp:Transcript_86738/g.273659  ORF Transcript_86738/g.273659 Transcript_86738/m.273659 type:complete len:477 (-) Transcript_86738:960-2390(-)
MLQRQGLAQGVPRAGLPVLRLERGPPAGRGPAARRGVLRGAPHVPLQPHRPGAVSGAVCAHGLQDPVARGGRRQGRQGRGDLHHNHGEGEQRLEGHGNGVQPRREVGVRGRDARGPLHGLRRGLHLHGARGVLRSGRGGADDPPAPRLRRGHQQRQRRLLRARQQPVPEGAAGPPGAGGGAPRRHDDRLPEEGRVQVLGGREVRVVPGGRARRHLGDARRAPGLRGPDPRQRSEIAAGVPGVHPPYQNDGHRIESRLPVQEHHLRQQGLLRCPGFGPSHLDLEGNSGRPWVSGRRRRRDSAPFAQGLRRWHQHEGGWLLLQVRLRATVTRVGQHDRHGPGAEVHHAVHRPVLPRPHLRHLPQREEHEAQHLRAVPRGLREDDARGDRLPGPDGRTVDRRGGAHARPQRAAAVQAVDVGLPRASAERGPAGPRAQEDDERDLPQDGHPQDRGHHLQRLRQRVRGRRHHRRAEHGALL